MTKENKLYRTVLMVLGFSFFTQTTYRFDSYPKYQFTSMFSFPKVHLTLRCIDLTHNCKVPGGKQAKKKPGTGRAARGGGGGHDEAIPSTDRPAGIFAHRLTDRVGRFDCQQFSLIFTPGVMLVILYLKRPGRTFSFKNSKLSRRKGCHFI